MAQYLAATQEMSRGVPCDHRVALRKSNCGREGRAYHTATRTCARAIATNCMCVPPRM